MSFLTVCDEPYSVEKHGEFEGEFEKKYFKSKYPWDSFQLHSFRAIQRGENVLVIAPTSSGKTSVGRYAIVHTLFASKKRVIYTTPIKTLSNEKYAEMKEMLAEFDVVPGLLTGDQQINIDSMMVIATQEIICNGLKNMRDEELANQLANQLENEQTELPTKPKLTSDFFKSIGTIIIDEIHYLANKDRGKAWEETLIMLDPSIQIIGLSATISHPEEFGKWLSDMKKHQTCLVKKYDRPVPLEYNIYDGKDLHMIMDCESNYNTENFNKARIAIDSFEQLHKMNKTDRTVDMLNKFIDHAVENNLIQVGFIVFSKKNCERFADLVKTNLMDYKERANATKELERTLGIHLKDFQNHPRYIQLKRLIERGIAFHHAGLPVMLKEAVEQLFKSGIIKILFATETIAVGVNMPIRTMVFVGLQKSDGNNKMRTVDPAEFKQMCGRAGRRGLDTKGLVVLLPLYGLIDEQILRRDLLFGPMPHIISQMEPSPHQYLQIIYGNKLNPFEFFKSSLLFKQQSGQTKIAELEIETAEIDLNQSELQIANWIDQNKVSDQTLQQLKELLEMKQQKDNFAGMQVRLNKTQQKKQKLLEDCAGQNQKLYQLLEENRQFQIALKKATNRMNDLVNYMDMMYGNIKGFLIETDYLSQNNTLTEYGVICAQINDCNPFLLAEIMTGGILEKFTPKQLVCLLSIFTDPIGRMNRAELTLGSVVCDKIVKESIQFVEERSSFYQKIEKKHNIYNQEFWQISYDYIELAGRWFDLKTEDQMSILQDLTDIEEYEGSFIKNMMSINNIVGNIMKICNMMGWIEKLPMLQEIEPRIVKGMVNAMSLHVV